MPPQSPARMDIFAKHTTVLQDYIDKHKKSKPDSYDEVVRVHMLQLLRELDELAPERVRQVKQENGLSDWALLLMQEAASTKDKHERKGKLHPLSGAIYEMRGRIFPQDELKKGPAKNSEAHPEHSCAHAIFLQRVVYAVNHDGDKNKPFTSLSEYTTRARHVVALIELRDQLAKIKSLGGIKGEGSNQQLHAALKAYQRGKFHSNEQHLKQAEQAIADLDHDRKDKKIECAVEAISNHTHHFLKNFPENIIEEYKKDRKHLSKSNPTALQSTSELLGQVSELRWVKAASRIHSMLDDVQPSLLAMPSINPSCQVR